MHRIGWDSTTVRHCCSNAYNPILMVQTSVSILSARSRSLTRIVLVPVPAPTSGSVFIFSVIATWTCQSIIMAQLGGADPLGGWTCSQEQQVEAAQTPVPWEAAKR